MSDIATTAALSDDPWMPGRSKANYIAPKTSEAAMLSELLHGTGRFPDNRQLKLVGDPKDPGDIKVFYAGDVSLLKLPCVAVVGTREVSDAGRLRTRRIARELAQAGIAVVSGLAYGVDAVAHTTAIESGGKTIAVVGTPLSKASPSENAKLQEKIYREHLLVSRLAEGEKTNRSQFPLRNRLMAMMSDATVVMEASDRSGTLHQAAECTKLGRWLFIAKSVVDDPNISWPRDFLKYKTCVVLEHVSQITTRVIRSSQ